MNCGNVWLLQVSLSYQVDGHSFFPRALIHNTGIVAQDVDSSESFYCFLKGS